MRQGSHLPPLPIMYSVSSVALVSEKELSRSLLRGRSFDSQTAHNYSQLEQGVERAEMIHRPFPYAELES